MELSLLPTLAQELQVVVLDNLVGRQNNAAEAAPLAVDVLGGRIDHHVGAERQGRLPQRGGEDVVDDDLCADGVGHLGDGADVGDFQDRVRGRLDQPRSAFRLFARSCDPAFQNNAEHG